MTLKRVGDKIVDEIISVKEVDIQKLEQELVLREAYLAAKQAEVNELIGKIEAYNLLEKEIT